MATSQDDVNSGEHHSVGIGGFCVAAPGDGTAATVTVDRVDLLQPTGGLRIAGFTVRPNPADFGGQVFGEQPVSIQESGIPLSHRVTTACPPNGSAGPTDEIVLDYVREGAETGDSKGVRITWTSEGQSGELQFSFRQILCRPGESDNKLCL